MHLDDRVERGKRLYGAEPFQYERTDLQDGANFESSKLG